MFFGVAGAFTVAGVLVALVWAFVRQSWKDATLDVWRKQWDLQDKRNALEREKNDLERNARNDLEHAVVKRKLRENGDSNPYLCNGLMGYRPEYEYIGKASLDQLKTMAKEYGIEYVEPDTSDLDKQINELTKQLIRLGAE
jgi:paraquat-inducible protein B